MNKKIILGILTFSPVIGFIAYFILLGFGISGLFSDLGADGSDIEPLGDFFIYYGWAFVAIGLSVLISLGMMIYYIIHILNNVDNKNNMQLLWILVIIFANFIGQAIYYFMEILKLGDRDRYSTERDY